MKANPGGAMAIGDILGRGALVSTIWDRLQQQSLVLTAERRMGKTHVIRLLHERPQPGWHPVFCDLERYHAPAEFAQSVYRDVGTFLGHWSKTTRKATTLLKSLRGVEVAGLLRLPAAAADSWKDLLESSIEDLLDAKVDDQLVFLWDELPYMLQNIAEEDRDGARQLLDTLRALRTSHPRLRMVLTGSLGLHHVLDRLRRDGYVGDPFNDLLKIEVPPLAPADGAELARRLIAGEGLRCADPGASSRHLTAVVDHVAFYIHHVVAALREANRPAEIDDIDGVVRQALTDPDDRWRLSHYRTRLTPYYSDRHAVAQALIDLCAQCPGASHDVDELRDALPMDVERDDLLGLLKLLCADHYLVRDERGYRFRFELLRRWWCQERAL